MKINLRKASAIQDIIQAEIKQLGSASTTLTVSIFDTDLSDKLDAQLTKVRENNQRVGSLLEANSYIRAIVAKKNAEVGITDYLAEEAMLASAEVRTRSVTELKTRLDTKALLLEIDARRVASQDASRPSIYGRQYDVEINVATQEYVDEAKRSLDTIKKRRRKIKDEMVSINVRTEFEVPERVALVLTSLGLD